MAPEELPGTKLDEAISEIANAAVLPAAKTFGQSAKESGKIAGDLLVDATKTAAGIVRIGLAPLKAVVWGWERVEEKIIPKIVSKIEQIPEHKRIVPRPALIGAALDSAKFVTDEPSLCEMFATLCASAAHADLVEELHPAFVELLRQISPVEATILQHLGVSSRYAGRLVQIREIVKPENNHGLQGFVVHQNHIAVWKRGEEYLDPKIVERAYENFSRLGICEVTYEEYLPPDSAYEIFSTIPIVSELKGRIEAAHNACIIEKGMYRVTALGRAFLRVCVSSNG